MRVNCIQSANAILGEGPIWDVSQGLLYWVDIMRPAVFCWDPRKGQTGHWPSSHPIGCVAITQSERLVLADTNGFAFLELNSGRICPIGNPESDQPQNRFNDGKVDRAGRFWAGTMHKECASPTGSLYRLDADLSIHRLATGFVCSNGLGWSPDSRTMYFTDSMVRTIWAYDFDFDDGSLGARRIFAKLSDTDGVPDGLTVDSEGCVWSAIWDGWRVIRYAPDGNVDQQIHLPIQRPTSCMFGGPELKTLYITSACLELGWESLKKGPLAGGLFALQTEVPGLPEPTFGGG